MSSEARVRAALERGEAPDTDDIRSLLDELQELREQSEQRWQAIGRLAPAAKKHRGESQARARVIAALDEHLQDLPGGDDSELGEWAARARTILARK